MVVVVVVSLANTSLGRKWENVIWNYFDYSEQMHKSKYCTVDSHVWKESSMLLVETN